MTRPDPHTDAGAPGWQLAIVPEPTDAEAAALTVALLALLDAPTEPPPAPPPAPWRVAARREALFGRRDGGGGWGRARAGRR